MQTKRLDEILIEEGLISESQIRDALLRQKVHGGKFGSQLLYHRYITEYQLVKALAIQMNCEGVVISDIDIPEKVIKMIPKRVAIARKVMPFEYDSHRNVLKIACEDPTDESLVKELSFVVVGSHTELCVAAEIALNTVITRYYLKIDTTIDDNLLLEIPDEAAQDGIQPDDGLETNLICDSRSHVLLVTDEEFSAPLLKSILERNSHHITITDTTDGALHLLKDMIYQAVLVRRCLCEDTKDFVDRIRGISPTTMVQVYTDAPSLILDDHDQVGDHLFLKNLDLLTSLLASEAKMLSNHSSQVGQYADRLCRRLRFPRADRLLISSAGYLHDLAQFYYGTAVGDDNRQIIELTANLLGSLGYRETVILLLRAMYTDVDLRGTTSMPIEVLGGNVLTVVDLFCHTVSQDQWLSLDRFDAIKKRLRDHVGKLFLANVVEAFIGMVQDEILDTQTSRRVAHIMVYYEVPTAFQPLDLRLRNEGFVTIPVNTAESLIGVCCRSQPDIILLMWSGQGQEITSLFDSLEGAGINFAEVPTFLLAESSSVPLLTDTLERGLEDIVAVDGNLDLLVGKLRKLESKLGTDDSTQATPDNLTLGTAGQLTDMNLIDLIQTLAPDRSNVKIALRHDKADADTLTVYLRDGQIVFAELGDLSGVEAIYEGLTWTWGKWQIDPVSPENIPDPNITTPNESVLMEGCRLLDERVKAGHLL
jgi:DNA-binding response OmpR family regulator